MKSIFPEGLTLKGVQQVAQNNFAETLGLEFSELGKDFLKGTLVVDERHLRPGGIVNGGVFLGMIETVGSVAARMVILKEPKNSLGIQINANHLRVAKVGDTLTAIAKPVHIGKTTHLWNVSIENQEGKTISSGTITLLITSKQ